MKTKRWLSILLCFALMLSLLPTTVIAEGIEPEITPSTDAEVHTESSTTPTAEIEPTENLPETTAAPTEPTQAPTQPTEAPTQPTEEPTAVERVQALIDALPDADSITAENAEAVKAQLAAIDEAKAALTDEDLDSLDFTRYEAAVEALSTLGGRAGENTPDTLATGAFTVTGGVSGSDYSYGGGVLTIRTGTPVTIRNTDPSTATTDRIEVADGVSANITLAGVNIDVSGKKDTAAFKIADNSSGNVTITLAEGTVNTLKSGENRAGLQKSGGTGSGKLTINGPGTLNATGGRRGAGIGGGAGGHGSNITINGGNITATSVMWAAGIGGGDNASGSNITINGGTVYARGGTNGAGIGGGTNQGGSNILITGGYVTAAAGSGDREGITVLSTGADGNAVIVASSIKDRSDQANWSGVIYEGYPGTVYGNVTLAGNLTIVAGKPLTIPAGASLTIPEGVSLTVPSGTTLTNNGTINNYGTIRIAVSGTLNNKGTFNNYGNIKMTFSYIDEYGSENSQECIVVANQTTLDAGWYVVSSDVTISSRITVSGDVHLILCDGKTLTASQGITVEGVNSLSIYAQSTGDGMGTLVATGGEPIAGIGGCNQNAGIITINGGNIRATGGNNGAGIGGRNWCSGGTITINGGNVTAIGKSWGIGIGCGNGGSGGTLTINGGTVTAASEYATCCIRTGTVTITGGTVVATGGSTGIDATFTTGDTGNAFIDAASISDQSGKESWHGAIIEGNEGKVYGTNVTLENSATIPSGKTLTVPEGKTLTVGSGTTLTVNGTLKIDGEVIADGNLSFGANRVQTKVTLEPNGGTPAETLVYASYGEPYDLPELTKEGHAFLGWYTEAVGGTRVDHTTTVTSLSAHTLYARFVQTLSVNYLDEHGGEKNQTCMLITNQTTLDPGWYVVNSTVAINSKRITVSGEVHLILADNTTLNSIGINVDSGNSLTIYAQSTGSNMGKLVATTASGQEAGITCGGTLTINGGDITARGRNFGAGIGGKNAWQSGGSRDPRGSCGTVIINGGIVKAIGTENAAGIGGGQCGNGGTVIINGGTVEATAGPSGPRAIGAGGGGGTTSNGSLKIGTPGSEKVWYVKGGADASGAANVEGSPFTAAQDNISGNVSGKKYVKIYQGQIPVPYMDADGTNQNCEEYTVLTSDMTSLSAGWYVVNSDVTIGNRMTVSGDVHLILADGCKLTAEEGIAVNDPNKLYIYWQSGKTGALVAYNPDNNQSSLGAAIGADMSTTAGTITINGGNITASVRIYGGACIGQGGWGGAGGTVTINDGHLILSNSAGDEGAFGSGSTRTINGGIIEYTSTTTRDTITGSAMSNCIVFNKSNTGTVYGNPTIDFNYTMDSEKTITVGSDQTVTVAEGATLTNNGTIYVDGALTGTVTGNGSVYYPLTVNDGTANPISTQGGKTYAEAGETITLTAVSAAPVGQAVKWICDGVTLTGNTFTMPSKAVTVTADGYRNAPTYTVTIPASVEVGKTAKVEASGVNVVSGSTLTVTIDSGTSFTMTSGEGATLDYAVHADNKNGALLSKGDAILQIAGGQKNDAASAVLAFTLASGEEETYSGVYQGTITFTISIN